MIMRMYSLQAPGFAFKPRAAQGANIADRSGAWSGIMALNAKVVEGEQG